MPDLDILLSTAAKLEGRSAWKSASDARDAVKVNSTSECEDDGKGHPRDEEVGAVSDA